MARSPQSSDETPSQIFKSSERFQAGARALGRRVRQLRHERGLSLYQASAAMDLELSHLQRIEAGTLNPTLSTLMRVADGLGVKVMELVSEV